MNTDPPATPGRDTQSNRRAYVMIIRIAEKYLRFGPRARRCSSMKRAQLRTQPRAAEARANDSNFRVLDSAHFRVGVGQVIHFFMSVVYGLFVTGELVFPNKNLST